MDQDKDENSIHINIDPIPTIDTINDTINNTINDTISNTKDTINSSISSISSNVSELNTFKNSFTSGLLPRFMLNKSLPSIQSISNNIKNGIQNGIQNEIQTNIQLTSNSIQSGIQNVSNGIQNTSNDIKNGIQSVSNDIQNVSNDIQNVSNDIQNGIQSVYNDTQNEIQNSIKSSKPNTRPNSSLNSKANSKASSRRQSESELKVKPEDATLITSSRSRKLDRRNLSNDILAELPISIRFNDSINIDNNETLDNYIEDWKKWDDDDSNKLDILIEEIWTEEEKYKQSASFNHNCARGIQFTLILMGMSGIFLQSKGASPETVNNYTIASSALTTLTSSLLTFFSFSKKAPHFAKISFMLRRLRNWVDKLLIIPVDKRCSPYDIYTIAKITFEAILNEAKEGLSEHK
jgi:hypothetical protein